MPFSRTSRAGEKQDRHKDYEGDRRSPLGANDLHGCRFRQADDQSSDHRAGNAANPAEDCGCKQRQQQVMAKIGADLYEQPGHDAGDAGEGSADEPDDADHTAHVHTSDAR
jgi:hypothetical protein